ncbi:hypothetical protein CDAR_505141 [Caerostris darwini]|uniref:RNase H type-1 domain-containing protein n=1 Tax=Caerostris darwini TaxID=1538125 RepID=A0AAV4NVH5_9ARAC|nr:hypothetical protein CDAR_505141 [Caerostris darwini]
MVILIDEVAAADVYSEILSQYALVGKFMTNFDFEMYAIHLAINNLTIRVNSDCYTKVVLFIDSRAAILAGLSNPPTETPIIAQIKKDIKYLRTKAKQDVFQ